MTKLEFYRMCETADWWYGMSDDGDAYRRGEESMKQLRAACGDDPDFCEIYSAFYRHSWLNGPKPEPPEE